MVWVPCPGQENTVAMAPGKETSSSGNDIPLELFDDPELVSAKGFEWGCICEFLEIVKDLCSESSIRVLANT